MFGFVVSLFFGGSDGLSLLVFVVCVFVCLPFLVSSAPFCFVLLFSFDLFMILFHVLNSVCSGFFGVFFSFVSHCLAFLELGFFLFFVWVWLNRFRVFLFGLVFLVLGCSFSFFGGGLFVFPFNSLVASLLKHFSFFSYIDKHTKRAGLGGGILRLVLAMLFLLFDAFWVTWVEF